MRELLVYVVIGGEVFLERTLIVFSRVAGAVGVTGLHLGASGAELSMGPFCVTRSNPIHQLIDPTKSNSLRPNPIQLTV